MTDTYTPAMFLTVKGKRIDWKETDRKVMEWLIKTYPSEGTGVRALNFGEITRSLRKLVHRRGCKAIIAALEAVMP